MTDYRTLLVKYIRYIVDVEGSDYIEPYDRRYQSDVNFTDEEWEILKFISEKQE